LSAVDAVRPEIRALKAYSVPAADGPRITTKLDFNESPFDVPADIKELVLARVARRRWSLYPEQGNPRLRSAIAAAIGRKPDEVAVGNGSGELLLAAVSVLAGGGGTLLLAPPTFSLYRQMAAIAGARVETVARVGRDLAVDEGAFLASARSGRVLPLVCSPNNPTGGVVSRDFVRRLAQASAVVILDQAYVDFASPADDVLPLLDELPNLVVFRTLSKAFAAAGFRIGYVVARAELLREIEKGYLPYSVDWAAEELGLALLERPEVSRAAVSRLVAERRRVAAALVELGLVVPESRANFVFFMPGGGDGHGLYRGLLARGIQVRDLDATHAGHVRISIGSPEENDRLLAALKEVL
jgi:histidinol-phosphate aminotransferase